MCVCWTTGGTGLELSRKMDDLVLVEIHLLIMWKFVGAAEVLPLVEADLKKIAGRIVEKAKEICISKLVFLLLLLSFLLG